MANENPHRLDDLRLTEDGRLFSKSMTPSGPDIKAVLLVGGMGTRLRAVVPSTAKPMASVGGRPFLSLPIQQLASQNIRQLVMCTGYRSEDIEQELGDGRSMNLAIEYSREQSPLGTAGAIKYAKPLLVGVSDFLVMNGDSFVEMDFGELVAFHRKSGGIAAMVVIRTKNDRRYGTVQMGIDGRVSGFVEKTAAAPNGLINAGVYIFKREIFEQIPEGPASLETDVFPKLLPLGVYALEQHGVFIDIGTPEDYAHAQEISARLNKAALGKQERPSSG